MIEEYGVHRLSYRVVSTEREGEIGYTARHVYFRHLLMYGAACFDECPSVVVVLRHTSGNGEDVRVEDDVFTRESDTFEQSVCPSCHFHFPLVCVCLSIFIEEHHDGGCSHSVDIAGFLEEFLFAFLERDGVDDALSLHALQSSLEDFPFGRVDHDRHTCYLRLRGYEIEECGHGFHAVDESVVHADVNDLSTSIYLRSCYGEGFFIVACLDETLEFSRTSDVGALAYIDEACVAIEHQRLKSR